MTRLRSHWANAGLAFLVTFLGAGVLLPLVRIQPALMHEYFNTLHSWLRVSVTFFVAIVFTALMVHILSPRLGQLVHWQSHPPAWSAVLVAFLVVAVVDLSFGFTATGYQAATWEWLLYGAVPVALVGWYHGVLSDISQNVRNRREPRAKTEEPSTLQGVDTAPWDEIAAWLESDAPARYDFLDYQGVADRVYRLISEGTRSVGIVGPFGTGKTTLVRWIEDRLRHDTDSETRSFVCYHSCWGFETSGSAIHDMLGLAISQLRSVVDTFPVDSLPDSYRQTFCACGSWADAMSRLLVHNSGPTEQFERLSALLASIGARMVFIVEDLDRNESRNFDIQEVLAFLERLKRFRGLQFVLTGGRSSSRRVDYSKLCDHIEYLRGVHQRYSSLLVKRVTERCLDGDVFAHARLADPSRNYECNRLSDMFMRGYEELPLPQAVATLLNRPRFLRHALARTVEAWKYLHGEIAFDHLLGLNILRFGAPECFDFLIRRWEWLHSPPDPNPTFGRDRMQRIRDSVRNDWERTIRNVEWNPTAAMQVMQFVLPTTEDWLSCRSPAGISAVPQGVSRERYWIRAVNESIGDEEVRDQEVIRDIESWLRKPGTEAELVVKLTSVPEYCDVWEELAGTFFSGQRDRILLLCEHVLRCILQQQGRFAGRHSSGFAHTERFATRHLAPAAENSAWLQDRICEAAPVSIAMVNDLWQRYGVPGERSILNREHGPTVRQHVLDTVKANLTNGQSLMDRLSPDAPTTIYALVFDPRNDGSQSVTDAQCWAWLGPVLLDALRSRDLAAAVNCAVLLGPNRSTQERGPVNMEVLNTFFGDAAGEVIDILDEMVALIPETYRAAVRNIVAVAREQLASGT